MTLEAPIEVNLSQELSAQELWEWLTKDEQIKFNEYFNADKEWILYLSQIELSELKRILWEDLSASHDADFDEFIDEQLKEWLASSDIFESVEWIPESFWDTLDALSREALFWSEGILARIPLSMTARDNIITSLSVSILWNIDVKSLSNESIEGAFDTAMKNFTTLKELVDTKEMVGPGITKNILDVAQDGERNTLFMNAHEWTKFFDTLIKESMSKEKIKSYIEKHNLSPDNTTEIENDISGLTTRSAEIMKTLLALPKKVPSTKPETKKPTVDPAEDTESTTLKVNPEDIPTEDEIDNLEKQGGFGAIIIKMLREIVKMIQQVSGSDEDADSSKPEKKEEKTPEAIETEKAELKKLIEWIPESQKNNSLIMALKEDSEKAEEIKTLIEWISPGTSFAQSFTELFKLWENGMSKIDTVSKIFDAQWLSGTLPAESTHLDKKIHFLKEYADYRKSEWVAWVESRQTKWKVWAKERKWKNWKRD